RIGLAEAGPPRPLPSAWWNRVSGDVVSLAENPLLAPRPVSLSPASALILEQTHMKVVEHVHEAEKKVEQLAVNCRNHQHVRWLPSRIFRGVSSEVRDSVVRVGGESGGGNHGGIFNNSHYVGTLVSPFK